MVEKLASSEIAQSRERFAQELIDLMRLDFEGRNLPHSTVLRVLEQAERDTRERLDKEIKQLKDEIRRLEMMVYDASQLVKTRGKW